MTRNYWIVFFVVLFVALAFQDYLFFSENFMREPYYVIGLNIILTSFGTFIYYTFINSFKK